MHSANRTAPFRGGSCQASPHSGRQFTLGAEEGGHAFCWSRECSPDARAHARAHAHAGIGRHGTVFSSVSPQREVTVPMVEEHLK